MAPTRAFRECGNVETFEMCERLAHGSLAPSGGLRMPSVPRCLEQFKSGFDMFEIFSDARQLTNFRHPNPVSAMPYTNSNGWHAQRPPPPGKAPFLELFEMCGVFRVWIFTDSNIQLLPRNRNVWVAQHDCRCGALPTSQTSHTRDSKCLRCLPMCGILNTSNISNGGSDPGGCLKHLTTYHPHVLHV